MDIASLIMNLEHLAKRMGLSFSELLAWISRNDREDKLPWED